MDLPYREKYVSQSLSNWNKKKMKVKEKRFHLLFFVLNEWYDDNQCEFFDKEMFIDLDQNILFTY